MSEQTETPTHHSVWADAAKVAIQVVRDSKPLDPPLIVCTMCSETITTLADMDRVTSLLTVAVEHRCPLPR